MTLHSNISATTHTTVQSCDSDRAFLSVLHEIERYYKELAKGTRIRIEKWVQKLAMTGHNLTWKRHRNAYAKLLLHMVLNRQIEAPFNSLPPEGSLSSFPVHLKAYTVRGAYNSSGSSILGTGRNNVFASEPGCGTGSANYVANTIINHQAQQRIQGSSVLQRRRYISNPYVPAPAGADTHASLFWRDVYTRVMESPMGEVLVGDVTLHMHEGKEVVEADVKVAPL